MRKPVLAVILLLFLSDLPFLFAAEIAQEGTPARKLQRGFLNIALSPIEISKELDKEKKVDSLIPSWVIGIERGSFYAAARALTGVYEMLTFPFAVPARYEAVVQPEFAWELLPEEKSEIKKKR